jgi:predicted O-methyltransferase YrrM
MKTPDGIFAGAERPPEPDMRRGASPLVAYAETLHAFRGRLFGLYAAQGAILERKVMPWSLGTTWGYWLAGWNGMQASKLNSAASIGDDEVRLFYDLCQLVRPSCSYIIGNSFGFSTFCLALAYPEGRVIAIDNWSEPDTAALNQPLTAAVTAAGGFTNVHVHTGSSPDDTAAALAAGGCGDQPISIAFIDGLHRESAALADFTGLLPHLDRRSVVLWHNVNATPGAFRDGWRAGGNALFDQMQVLRTHGPLGIYYSSTEHPALRAYLEDSSVIWPEWERYIHLVSHEAELNRFLELSASAPWRMAATLTRPIRMLVGRVRNRS